MKKDPPKAPLDIMQIELHLEESTHLGLLHFFKSQCILFTALNFSFSLIRLLHKAVL